MFVHIIILLCIIAYLAEHQISYYINKSDLFIKNISNNISSRNIIGKILENEKFKCGIEVGVKNGGYADILLDMWKSCKTYVMIDPWLEQKYYDDFANVPNDMQNKIFNNAMNIVKKYSYRVEFIIFKTTSEKAATYLKHNSYDFIYLDARHDYMSVKNDINWYYPLLKHGGILAGHDYQDVNGIEWTLDMYGKKNNNHKAVKSAVDEFAEKNKLIVIATQENNWKTWLIRKP